jgi:hypothetical protein
VARTRVVLLQRGVRLLRFRGDSDGRERRSGKQDTGSEQTAHGDVPDGREARPLDSNLRARRHTPQCNKAAGHLSCASALDRKSP